YKRVRWRAVCIIRAEQGPEWQHECLSGAECDVNMAGRAVPRSVGNGHEHDMVVDDGIAVSINRNGEYAEGPALINLVPAGGGFPEGMRVSVHSCKYRCRRTQAKERDGG